MTPEQQGLIEDIATRFAAAAPEGWNSLEVEVSILTSIDGFAATATDANGKETPFFIDDITDKKILRALGKLREDMASQNFGRGAWYILSLHIPRGGKPTVDFDYNTKPTFGVHVGEAAYKQDLQRFPRTEEHLPVWLGGKPKPAAAMDKPQPMASEKNETYQDPLFSPEPEAAPANNVSDTPPVTQEEEVAVEASAANEAVANASEQADLPADNTPGVTQTYQLENLQPDSPENEAQSVAAAIKAAGSQTTPPAPTVPVADTPWWDNPDPANQTDTDQTAAETTDTSASS